MFRPSTIALVVVVLVAPAAVEAQTKWDVTVIAGLFAGHSAAPDRQYYQESWFHTGLGGVIAGRHFNPNLKVEVEATHTGEGTQFIQRSVSIPGVPYPYPISAEAQTSVGSVATMLTWQFFENQWIHPFIQAGAAAEFDRRTVNTWAQNYFSGDPIRGGSAIPIAEQSVDGPNRATNVRGVIGGGVKMYVSPRLFVRTDGRVAFGQSPQHVSFRVGFGADF